MNGLTKDEIHALRYYQGILDCADQANPFWCDDKAYVTLNSLFFDGLETEKARAMEGRYLNVDIATDWQQVLFLTKQLLTSCHHYQHDSIHVNRVERFVDYQKFVDEKMFTSFISTSKNGYLKAYEDKYDLVLMDIDIAKNTPCIDLLAMLEGKEKAEEAEVLIAPYTSIIVEEKPLEECFFDIKDGNGNPPKVFCHVQVGSFCDIHSNPSFDISNEQIMAVKRVYQALNMHAQIKTEDIELYLQYKKGLRSMIIPWLYEID